jgi:hypothetical protein
LLVLGLGYLFATLYVFAAHSGADAQPGLSVDDIKATYSGSTETTQLETERSESRAAQAEPPLERRERPQRSERSEPQRTSGPVIRPA